MIRRPPRSTLFPYTTLFRSEFNTSTIVLPFVAADLGLTAGENPDFRYRVSVVLPDEDNERPPDDDAAPRSEEHTSELQSRQYLVCRLLLEKKKKSYSTPTPL